MLMSVLFFLWFIKCELPLSLRLRGGKCVFYKARIPYICTILAK